jgi:hypothetical protein
MRIFIKKTLNLNHQKITMRFLFIVLISSTFGFQLHAHNYYFGFAEMQYNATNQTLEATLVLSAHDLEDVLKSKKIIARELEFLEKDSLIIANLEIFVNSEFIVSTGSTRARFSLLGFEVLKNGLVQIYLLSDPLILGKSIDVSFSILMNEFPEQQNKLTFINNKQKRTAVFLPHKRTDSIILEA